jgi:hypothetical protein
MFGKPTNDLETFLERKNRWAKEEKQRKKCCGEGGVQEVQGRQIGWVMIALNKNPESGPRSVMLLPAMLSFEAYNRAKHAASEDKDDDEDELPVHEQRPSTAGEIEDYLMALIQKDFADAEAAAGGKGAEAEAASEEVEEAKDEQDTSNAAEEPGAEGAEAKDGAAAADDDAVGDADQDTAGQLEEKE